MTINTILPLVYMPMAMLMKLVVLKLIHEEDGDYVEIVEDEDLLNELSEKFKDTFK